VGIDRSYVVVVEGKGIGVGGSIIACCDAGSAARTEKIVNNATVIENTHIFMVSSPHIDP
jgi:hypothetical protein